MGIDWHVDLDEGRRRVGNSAVQGNLDPARCLAGSDLRSRRRARCSPRPATRPATFQPRHGVLPLDRSEVLEAVVRVVHDEGRAGVR